MDEEDAWWLEAFQTLSPSRPIHFHGPGAIPLSEVEAFCRILGIHEREDFMRLIRDVDRGYLELLEKSKPKT